MMFGSRLQFNILMRKLLDVFHLIMLVCGVASFPAVVQQSNILFLKLTDDIESNRNHRDIFVQFSEILLKL